MDTKIINIHETELGELNMAAQVLKSGGLVAFPTETVYGLGAIYNNEAALLRIFDAKGRPGDNPLILHIWSIKQLSELASEISPKAELLIRKFWPGPLTLIFPKQPWVSPTVTAGLATVAVRMPSHPVAKQLLRLVNIPVAAPSANLSGRPSPTRGSHVEDDLAGKVELIIEAGPCNAGIESTVLTLTEKRPLILRPGSVTKEMLETALNEAIDIAHPETVNQPQAPGMKYRHYAPKAPVILIEGENVKVVAEINRLLAENPASVKAIVLGTDENISQYRNEWVLNLGSQKDHAMVASRLYDSLRACDLLQADIIYIEGVTTDGVGLAVANRLRKAAGGNVIHVV